MCKDREAFFNMLDRHVASIKSTVRSDALVTIIVRAPGSETKEAMITTNDDLMYLSHVCAHFALEQKS